jgi:hypothetical protein
VNVKLPSEKLHVNQQFTVADGEEVDFVFDITVVEAGKSGKFVVKPVVSESGTDVPIERVGGDDDEDDRGEGAELNATFVDDVTAGSDATIEVTRDGDPAADASVEVGGEVVATTDEDGRADVSVPANGSLTVTVRADGDVVTLEPDVTDL